jgi:hypothetical protein
MNRRQLLQAKPQTTMVRIWCGRIGLEDLANPDGSKFDNLRMTQQVLNDATES